jgi:hypothetical protein
MPEGAHVILDFEVGFQDCECGEEIFRNDPFLASRTMSPVF